MKYPTESDKSPLRRRAPVTNSASGDSFFSALGRALAAVAVCVGLAAVSGCQGGRRPPRAASGELVMVDTGQRPYPGALDFSTDRGLSPAGANEAIRAVVCPPVGWEAEPLKSSERHTHQVWLSPTGATAFGVSHFGHFLLFLASDDAVLNEVLKGMRESSGTTQLIERHKDAALGGTRFVADAGPYRVRANLIRRGNEGWVIYAGTVLDRPVNSQELDLAERARELSEPGLR